MHRWRMWLGGAFALAALASGTLSGCAPREADGQEEGAEAQAQEYARVINVEVRELRPERFVEEIRLTAVATANQDVEVAAEETGVIRELFVDRGDRVEAGDPIAKIDDRVLAAQVEQARAAAELAQQTWERRKRLWEEDRVGSEIAYLEARYAAEQAAATLEGLQQRLARTVIRAPFGGVIEDRFVNIGTLVNSGDPVARLVDLDPIKVVAGVPERYAADVRVGEGATVQFDALGGEPVSATISYVGATVDPQNRTFVIEVAVPNPDHRIKPQMVANMGVTRRAVSEAIVVPQDALVRVENGYVVYVASEREGAAVAEVRPVTLGPARRNQVVIAEGVQEGDQLIVVGHKEVEDGDRIRIVAEG